MAGPLLAPPQPIQSTSLNSDASKLFSGLNPEQQAFTEKSGNQEGRKDDFITNSVLLDWTINFN